MQRYTIRHVWLTGPIDHKSCTVTYRFTTCSCYAWLIGEGTKGGNFGSNLRSKACLIDCFSSVLYERESTQRLTLLCYGFEKRGIHGRRVGECSVRRRDGPRRVCSRWGSLRQEANKVHISSETTRVCKSSVRTHPRSHTCRASPEQWARPLMFTV